MSVDGDPLIGLFFEVTPHQGHLKHYFSYVEKLQPELAKHSGLVSLNRYQTCLTILVFYPINYGKMRNLLKNGVTIRCTA